MDLSTQAIGCLVALITVLATVTLLLFKNINRPEPQHVQRQQHAAVAGQEVRAKPQHMLIRHDPSRCGTREARTQDCTI